ncbi:SHOCT domain-containing protein [Niveispirillum sp. KHB5.9]|uniref:SHOCT domain-containing protein n=1 Tax=Niveispirillum sp. KHB5.9 TaxID=3400269 RepID=UPI003A87330D
MIKNFDLYNKYTLDQNWTEICRLSGGELRITDVREEIAALPNLIEHNEIVLFLMSGVSNELSAADPIVAGGHTWLVVLTNWRLVFVNFRSYSGYTDVLSIPLDRLDAVSASFHSEIGDFIVNSGMRVVCINSCNGHSVTLMTRLVNEGERVLSINLSGFKGDRSDLVGQLQVLAELFAQGTLTDSEFTLAKAKLIGG